MKEKEAREIAEKFPESIKAFPRASFIKQLSEFIIKEKLNKN